MARTTETTWRHVDSTTVQFVGWNHHGMMVVFRSGGLYFYRGVSRQRAVAMAHAVTLTKLESVGKYLHQRIKGRFPYRRIR